MSAYAASATSATAALPADPRHLLDGFPLVRSRSADEACELVGRALSPHRLALCGAGRGFDARHNQIRLNQVALNVLSYGAEVEIDPGERGDFYLIQLPLRGRARLRSGQADVWVDSDTLSVLQPRMPTRMRWSGDCSMVLLQVPSAVLRQRLGSHGLDDAGPRFCFTQSRQDAAVAAWWQAVVDLTRNLHSHGQQWLRHPAAFAAMEAFLLGGLDLLQAPAGQPTAPQDTPARRPAADSRCLQRALDHLHAHAHEGMTLADIARAACVSPRALEAAFKRHLDTTPLAYARGLRLQRVHDCLSAARAEGRPASVTDAALQHGFVHMGRFAAFYKRRYGCVPSATLRGRVN
ncbi:MAG: AraC family transcriptional regulator [Burkholderiales bacterium PBB5]|nr:MAG: AraC family transcriptional regulator [Burkholderiales bacterium PBB5]